VRDFLHTSREGATESTSAAALGGGRAAQAAAHSLAVLVGSVARQGLDRALGDAGLQEYVGRPTGEVALALVDYLCKEGSLLDDVDVRGAVDDLFSELLLGTATYQDVRERLEGRLSVASLGYIIMQLYARYIYRRFCRVFYERLVTRRGEPCTREFLNSIRDYVRSMLEYKTWGKDPSTVDWTGHQGALMVEDIMQATLKIYEG
jgi:hypothetical protein